MAADNRSEFHIKKVRSNIDDAQHLDESQNFVNGNEQLSATGPRCILADQQLHDNSDDGASVYGGIGSGEECVDGEWLDDEFGVAVAVTIESNDNNVIFKRGGPRSNFVSYQAQKAIPEQQPVVFAKSDIEKWRRCPW